MFQDRRDHHDHHIKERHVGMWRAYGLHIFINIRVPVFQNWHFGVGILLGHGISSAAELGHC